MIQSDALLFCTNLATSIIRNGLYTQAKAQNKE